MDAKTRTTRWEVTDYLGTPEARAAFLKAAFEENDPALMAEAVGAVARAAGMASVAQKTGLSRESLYRSLSAQGNPELATLVKVVDALGLAFDIQPKPAET